MGNCSFNLRSNKRKVTIMVVGLDNAGKTSIVRLLRRENTEDTTPTVGFAPTTLDHRLASVTLYDVGGGRQIRGIWNNYVSECHGFVYIIDSSDIGRMEETRSTLHEFISNEYVKAKPLLLLANKQDKDGALDELEMCEQLQIEHIVNTHQCPTRIEICTALCSHDKHLEKETWTAVGMGFDWLLTYIKQHFTEINSRVVSESTAEKERMEEIRQQRLAKLRQIREQNQSQEDQNGNEDEMTGSDPFRPITELVGEMKPALPRMVPHHHENGIEEEDETVEPSERMSEPEIEQSRVSSANSTQSGTVSPAGEETKKKRGLFKRNNKTAPMEGSIDAESGCTDETVIDKQNYTSLVGSGQSKLPPLIRACPATPLPDRERVVGDVMSGNWGLGDELVKVEAGLGQLDLGDNRVT